MIPGVASPFPQDLTPMQPKLAQPFHRDRWVYEEKYDGADARWMV